MLSRAVLYYLMCIVVCFMIINWFHSVIHRNCGSRVDILTRLQAGDCGIMV
jgi:hypothetical protein